MAEEEKNDKTEEKDKEEKKEKPTPKDQIVETEHSVTIGGKKISYTVTTGTIVLKEEDEKEGEQAKASIFFTAYTKKGEDNPGKRPLTFAFNGGPGSSSVWLHLGVLGPRRVLMDEEGMPLQPPYKLVDNDYSILDKTDLVFIDPVSTGFSRSVPGEEAKQFHGFKKDIESVGDFIRLYTTRYNRWLSPKFLAGESYGTTRSAGLSGYLQKRHGMYLNGILLISSVLNFQTLRFFPGNDLPYIMFLPTYAATAFYHKRLPARLQTDLLDTLKEVEEFAAGEYASALMKGDALSDEEEQGVVTKLATYTGLSPEQIRQTNLRINIFRFTKQLLRDERRTVGRLDSRFKGFDRDAADSMWEHDPSMSAIIGPYTACLNDYVRRELEFESDLPYEILTSRVWPWSYKEAENTYLNVAETLREAMSINQHLKVFVANGYYDLATPYFATEYTFKHMELEDAVRDNVSMTYYEAGHMMYIQMRSLKKLKDDMAKFIDESLPT